MADKVAIVTAAGSGMGKAIAEKLNSDGYKLVLMSKSNNAKDLAEKYGQIGMSGDLTDKRDLKKLVDLAMDNFGHIDALILSTGHPAKGDINDLSDKQWHEGMDLVLLNVIRLIRMVTPFMVKKRSGSIVLISSFAALEPSLDFPISSVMRSALASFVKLFCQRYAGVGLRINSVLPGFIDSYAQSEETILSVPAKRLGKVSEVADTVSFLLSDGAAYINGQNIPVDGGLSKHL